MFRKEADGLWSEVSARVEEPAQPLGRQGAAFVGGERYPHVPALEVCVYELLNAV